MSVDTTSHCSTMKERLDESFKKQNARSEGSLDCASFFKGYSVCLQERDIVLEKLDKAKEIIKDLLSLKASASSAEDVIKRFSVRERAVEFLKKE